MKEAFIATTASSEILECSQINRLTMHLVALEKQEEDKLQISKWNETTENKTKTNEVETKKPQGSSEANN